MHNLTQKPAGSYASYARVMHGLHNHKHPDNKGDSINVMHICRGICVSGKTGGFRAHACITCITCITVEIQALTRTLHRQLAAVKITRHRLAALLEQVEGAS